MEIIKEKTITGVDIEEFGALLVSVISKTVILDIGRQFILRIEDMQLDNGRVDCFVCNPKYSMSFVYVLFTFYHTEGTIKCRAETHNWTSIFDKILSISATRRITNKLLKQIFEQL